MRATSLHRAWPRARASSVAACSATNTRTWPISHETLVYGLRIDEWRADRQGDDRRRSRPTACTRFSPCPTSKRQQKHYRDELGFNIGFLGMVIRRPMARWCSASGPRPASASIFRRLTPPRRPASALYLNVGPGLDRLCAHLPRPRHRSRRRGARAAAVGRARVRAARLQRLSARGSRRLREGYRRALPPVALSGGKTRSQSRFMSTTVQPRALASSSALSSLPMCDWRS